MLVRKCRCHWSSAHFSMHSVQHTLFSDVLNADISSLDNIDSYYTDPHCNTKQKQEVKLPLG